MEPAQLPEFLDRCSGGQVEPGLGRGLQRRAERSNMLQSHARNVLREVCRALIWVWERPELVPSPVVVPLPPPVLPPAAVGGGVAALEVVVPSTAEEVVSVVLLFCYCMRVNSLATSSSY
jgi:hypothetical protein